MQVIKNVLVTIISFALYRYRLLDGLWATYGIPATYVNVKLKRYSTSDLKCK